MNSTSDSSLSEFATPMAATPMKTRRAFHNDSVGKALTKPPLAQRLVDQVPHFCLVQDRHWKSCPDATVPCDLEVIVRHHHDNGVDNYTAVVVECGEKHCNVKYRLDDGSMSEAISCPTEHIKPYFGHLLAPGFSNQKSFDLRAMQETCLDDDTDFDPTYETDVTARKPRSENARGLTTVGEAWDYMEQVHHAYVHDLYILSVRTSDP